MSVARTARRGRVRARQSKKYGKSQRPYAGKPGKGGATSVVSMFTQFKKSSSNK